MAGSPLRYVAAMPPLSFDDVLAARERIGSRVLVTPMLQVPALDHIAGVKLFLKAENLQRIGAFKARGAMNAVLSLPAEARARGLVTYSSGNHGQAVALAAKDCGVPCHVVMPTDAPEIKVRSVRGLGAQVSFAGATSEERKALAEEIVSRTGSAMVPPFDDGAVIAGQGTATLELLEQARSAGEQLDAVLAPVGGGGLLAGACLAASGFPTPPRVIAVEPEQADALRQSLAQGERVKVVAGPTIADGLKPVAVGVLPFEVARAHVKTALTVSDDAIGRALVALLLHGKILVEPSGAAALAAALERALPSGLAKVGVLLSGGNLAPALLAKLITMYGESSR